MPPLPRRPRPHFHALPADDRAAGLNFSFYFRGITHYSLFYLTAGLLATLGCDPAEPSEEVTPSPAATSSPTPAPLAVRCPVDQPYPYLDSPYPGLHGNASNAERVPCAGPMQAPTPGWRALEGFLIFNPMTVGRDALYAVVTRTTGCKLWKVDLETGDETCFPQENPEALSLGVLGSGPELDEDGNVYVADGWETQPDAVVSYDEDGDLRWRTTFEGLHSPPLETYSPPLGVHFTPAGHVATVTPDGLVILLDRDSGAVLSSYSLIHQGGFAPLPQAEEEAPRTVPKYLECRIERVIGEDMTLDQLLLAFTGGTGGSGAYTDNSLGGSGDLLFVAGGSRDAGNGLAEAGALVALKLGGSASAPSLSLHWYLETLSGTGSSPTVDPSGRFVVVSDTTAEGRARLVVADIDQCNALAGQEDPRCEPAWTYTLEGMTLGGHVSIDEDGVAYGWNQGDPLEGAPSPMPQLLAVAGPDEGHTQAYARWTTYLPGPEGTTWDTSQWTSTTLVLDNQVVGTLSHLVVAETGEVQTQPPTTTHTAHELVGVDRATGEVVWRGVPVPDDSINSPLMGPDGHFYVPIYGMIDFMGIPEDPPRSCENFEDTGYEGGIAQYLTVP